MIGKSKGEMERILKDIYEKAGEIGSDSLMTSLLNSKSLIYERFLFYISVNNIKK